MTLLHHLWAQDVFALELWHKMAGDVSYFTTAISIYKALQQQDQ